MHLSSWKVCGEKSTGQNITQLRWVEGDGTVNHSRFRCPLAHLLGVLESTDHSQELAHSACFQIQVSLKQTKKGSVFGHPLENIAETMEGKTMGA